MHAGKYTRQYTSELKMAEAPERESIRIHDEYEEWMRVFESIVQLLDDYEKYRRNTSNVSVYPHDGVSGCSATASNCLYITGKSGLLFVYWIFFFFFNI